jgi:tetratricopeptide (TPR) repeat protein
MSARRDIQRGNALYEDGRYEEAVLAYERALDRVSLATGHHNAGLAYSRLFRPGLDSEDNAAYAERATAHLAKYLESEPDDPVIASLMTRIWMDSGRYELALAYWEGLLAEDPTDLDVISSLAGINRQAGRWEESIRWLYRKADAEQTDDGKVGAYTEIARLCFSRLDSSTERPGELARLELADAGIAAMQKAEALAPDSTEVHGYLGSLYERRSLAHGASWAQVVDLASAQHHRRRWRALQEAAAASASAQDPEPATPDESAQAPRAPGG